MIRSPQDGIESTILTFTVRCSAAALRRLKRFRPVSLFADKGSFRKYGSCRACKLWFYSSQKTNI